MLDPDLLERVLAKLGFEDRPSLDLDGLNMLYAIFCTSVPDDNIQKRIWFAGDQNTPVTGGNPTEFFENWLAHGTGGTCWPINGGVCTLLQSVGFDVRRIAGSMMVAAGPGTNHGSVIVTVDGRDYLVDAQIAALEALPLVPGIPTSTDGLHGISATPLRGGGFEVIFYPGAKRDTPLPFRTDPALDPVDHAFFVEGYERSRETSPFNEALYISRHYLQGIVTIFRNSKITVAADNTVTKTEISDAERKGVLVEELGISEEIVDALPADLPGDKELL